MPTLLASVLLVILMITVKDMQILEENAAQFGVSTAQLMENAGKAVSDYIRDHCTYSRALVVCGPGRNGGDGFVCARYLNCDVFFAGDIDSLPEASCSAYVKLDRLRIIDQVERVNFKQYDLIVDALFGYGVSGEIREPYRTVIMQLNALRHKPQIISIDFPSGFDAKNSSFDLKKSVYVKPSLVLALQDTKFPSGLFKTVVLDIGLPKEASQYVGMGDLKAALCERKKDARKGDHGKVLIIGGSDMHTGAPFLSSLGISALRSGTDLVLLAAPERVAWAINCLSPDLITRKIHGSFFTEEHLPEVLALSERMSAVLIGPGIGLCDETQNFVRRYVKEMRSRQVPLVIDADALKCVKIQDVRNAVFTPHRVEFEVLLKNSGLEEQQFMRKLGNSVLIAKGPEDRIFSSERMKLNTTGNPGMTVAGTGDVLSGLVAGFIAQGNSLFHAACAAAYVSGRCGDLLMKTHKYTYLASELPTMIPQILAEARAH